MQNYNFIKGTFQKELKNRFLCEVLVDGVATLCYVPSSCRLSNFLRLEGRSVLLVPTSERSKTQFALFAVCYRNSYILLNSSIANRVIDANLHKRRFSFLGKRKTVIKERSIYNYKTDLFLPETDTIIEIKSIISTDTTALFPSVYSERAINQLVYLQKLLKQGHRVCFFIVSLSPFVQQISIDAKTHFYKEFIRCIQLGMHVSAYSCRVKEGTVTISRTLPLNY